MSAILDVDVKSIHVVDWFTYARRRKKGLAGLSEFLAKRYGIKKREFDLLEAENDIERLVDVARKELDAYDAKELTGILADGSVEVWCLRTLLVDACNKGFIPEGMWLVKVSW